MSGILIYILKASVYLAGLFVVYWLFLGKDTIHCRNRIFILLSLAASFILPVITIQTKNPVILPLFGKILSDIFVSPTENGRILTTSGPAEFNTTKWIFTFYLSGVIFFSLKLITNVLSLVFLIIRQKISGSNVIMIHDLNTSGFSAFGYIFVSSSLSDEETNEIIRHEQNHLSQHHFLDIIFIETSKTFQWFNPFIHLFNKSLRAIHEYQADEECLNSGIPVVNYQHLLLNQIFKSKTFNFSNSFSNPSLLKKRMIMMTKKRSGSLTNLKLFLVLPIITIIMVAFSSCNQNNKTAEGTTEVAPPPPPPPPVAEIEKDNEPFTVVQEMPIYPGGETALLQFIQKNTTYPENAKINNIQGKVIVRFAVESDGSVDRASIIKGVDAELDKEALRVVTTLSAFKPGKQDGKAVPVWYMVPINFTLR